MFLSAEPWVLGLIGVTVLAVLAVVISSIPSVMDDLKDLSGRIARSGSLRVQLLAKVLPVTATVIVFALLVAFIPSLSVWMTLALALTVGVVLAVIGSILVRTKYALVRSVKSRDSGYQEVHLTPYTVSDADGRDIHVIEVDTHRLAHRSRERVIDDALALSNALIETGDAIGTESAHVGDKIEWGTVDLSRIRKQIRVKTRREAVVRTKANGGAIERELLKRSLENDYPETVVEEQLWKLRKKGDLSKRGTRVVAAGK